MHEYFYGAQSSTYSFIRVPTVLFTDDQYKYVSAEAKVLYCRCRKIKHLLLQRPIPPSSSKR